MITVDINGTPIREGDILMHCWTKIPGKFFKSGKDLRMGELVTAKFVDDDGTFVADGWTNREGGRFWFHGDEFEVVHEKEFTPDEVDFF